MSVCSCSATFKLSEALRKGKATGRLVVLHLGFIRVDVAEVMLNTEKSEPCQSTYVALMPLFYPMWFCLYPSITNQNSMHVFIYALTIYSHRLVLRKRKQLHNTFSILDFWMKEGY